MNNEKNDKETLEMPKKKENLNDIGTQELVEKKENDQSKKNKTLKNKLAQSISDSIEP